MVIRNKGEPPPSPYSSASVRFVFKRIIPSSNATSSTLNTTPINDILISISTASNSPSAKFSIACVKSSMTQFHLCQLLVVSCQLFIQLLIKTSPLALVLVMRLSRSVKSLRFIQVSCGVKHQQVVYLEAAISLRDDVSPISGGSV